MRFEDFSFGSIRIDGVTYNYDLVIDRGEIRKRTESWDDRQTGAKHYRDLFYIDRIEFLDSKGGGNGYREPAETAQDETTVTDEDVPF